MNNTEVWKPIIGYEGCYEVSNFGNVRSLPRTVNATWKNGKKGFYQVDGKILTPKECTRNKKGYQTYLQVCLSVNGVHKYAMIHRLVAEAFLPKQKGRDVVNHKDGDKHNNNVSNLEWVTHQENARHSLDVLSNKVLSPVECVEKKKKFRSMKEASAESGVHHSAISMAASGKRRTAGGFHWRYL